MILGKKTCNINGFRVQLNMSRFWKSVVLAAVVISLMFAGITLTACKSKITDRNDGNDGNDDVNGEYIVLGGGKISANLSNFTADLSGAQQVGITTWDKVKDDVDDTVPVASSRTNSEHSKKKRNRKDHDLVMVKVCENGELSEIGFEEEPDKIIFGGKVNADDFDLEIYKMHVFGDFTAVSYISTFWRSLPDDAYNVAWPDNKVFKLESGEEIKCWAGKANDGELINKVWTIIPENGSEIRIYDRIGDHWGVGWDFDRENYENTDFFKSYIIHNPTGKVYSSEEFSGFSIVNEFVVARILHPERSYDSINVYYDLSIDDEGNLNMRDILPNKDYWVAGASRDAEGWVYVEARVASTGGAWLNERNEETKTIYTIFENLRFASNGKVYIMEKISQDIEVDRPFYSGTVTLTYPVPVRVIRNGIPCDITTDDSFEVLATSQGLISYYTNGEHMINGIFYSSDPLWLRWDNTTSAMNKLLHDIQIQFFGYDCLNQKYLYYFLDDMPYFKENPDTWQHFFRQISQASYYMLYLQQGIQVTVCYYLLSEYMAPNGALTIIENGILIPNVRYVSDFVYSVATSTTTTEYEIVLGADGKPEFVEYSHKSYESIMIVLQPLN